MATYTPEQIRTRADSIIAGGGSWDDVWNEAQQYGVGLEELGGAYGMTGQQANDFATSQGIVTGWTGEPAASPAPEPAPQPTTTTSGSRGSSGLTSQQVNEYEQMYRNSGYVGNATWEAMTPETRAAIMSGNAYAPWSPFYNEKVPGLRLTAEEASNIPSSLVMYGLPEGQTLEQALGGGTLPQGYGTATYWAQRANAAPTGGGIVTGGGGGGGGATAPAAGPAAQPAGQPGQYTGQQIMDWLTQHGYNDPNVPYAQRVSTILQGMQQYGVTQQDLAAALTEATGQQVTVEQVQRYLAGQQDYFAPASGQNPGGGNSGGGIVSGGYTTTSSGAAQMGAPTTWTVTADQTVEGRIARIIGDTNNPLQVIARNNAMETANSRGLLNSAMAASAGERAAFEAAMPIASADAATFARAAGWNADQANQFAMKNADYENSFRASALDRDAQWRIAQLNAETQRTVAQLNNDAQAQAAQLQQEHQRLLETNSQASQAFSTAASAINNIQNNASMDQTAKTQAIANVWHDLQTQLRVLESTSGLNLTSTLNFAGYPGFDAQGNWVGFAASSGAAPTPPAAPGSTGTDHTGAGDGGGAE